MSSDKYIHSEVENKIYSYWEKNNLFKPKKNIKKVFYCNSSTKCNRKSTYGACFKQFNSGFTNKISQNE